jgi:lipopolysaccharide/colanic/teichoic acid biosynthesis glycosyltransferase
MDSHGGGFYFQTRVGRFGEDFRLVKFRTMSVGADQKSLLTIGGSDARITKIGNFLRFYKLDELAQLFNVLKGEMSFVGPRPEVRKYVELYNTEQLKVLSIRPGITDYASIKYANENELLGAVDDPERYYIEVILPDKISLNMKYIDNRTIVQYFKILFLSFRRIVTRD